MITTFLVLFLGLTCCAVGGLITSCPPPESIRCKCLGETYVDLHCSQIGDLDQLQGYSISLLELHDVNATSVPINLFEGLHIRKLKLLNFEVKDNYFDCEKDYQHFQGLETSLDILEVERSFRNYQPLRCIKLGHMKMLRIIHFNHNSIGIVKNEWFLNGPRSLKSLYFYDNKITYLDDKVFQSLENLVNLVVRGNTIRKISRSMFPIRAQHLSKIDFQDNTIRELPSDIFSNMPSLSVINFNKNFLQVLQQDTWSTVLPKTRYVTVFDNDFTYGLMGLICDGRMKWICKSRYEIVYGNCFSTLHGRKLTITRFCKLLA